jgi:endonuclease/exonuclease/phosphatase family metal-dependent hydrolase
MRYFFLFLLIFSFSNSYSTGLNNTNTLRVMTLNLAHGRGNNFHQILISNAQIKTNLDNIIKVSQREAPHVLAVQEVDNSAYWSGHINQVDYLATNSSLENTAQGNHVDGYILNYGTSILSRLQLQNSKSHTFTATSPLTFSKGFVVSTVKWPGKPDIEVDIVSVHLDFMLNSTRQHQAKEMVTYLDARNRPLILMGDFNDDWRREESVITYLTDSLALKAYQPNSEEFVSYPDSNKRLDWILISNELDFISFNVLPDVLSDHRAVIAELKLTE